MVRTHADEDFPDIGLRIGTYTHEYPSNDSCRYPGFLGVLYPYNYGSADVQWAIDGWHARKAKDLRAVADLLDLLTRSSNPSSEAAYKRYRSRAVFYLPEVMASEPT